MRTCSNSETSWLEYKVLPDPGIHFCQKERCTSEDCGNRGPGVPWQVTRTGQNQAQALGMLWGGLNEKPQDTERGKM